MVLLITGSQGLIGRELQNQLKAANIPFISFDKCHLPSQVGYGDILQKKELEKAINQCTGIIHLAALSRVIWGEYYPELCWETNVNGTQNILDIAANSTHKPWVIYASSREVYGQPTSLPATEDTPLNPINHYAKSKVAAENLVNDYRGHGINTLILRFSNVYGDIFDHPNRVVPAFCQAAALGGTIYLEGKDNLFDFTHVSDVVRGIMEAIKYMEEGISLPPIHFTSGEACSLKNLAVLANTLGGELAEIKYRNPRRFDVARFYGKATRAFQFLNWQHKTKLEEGVGKLINAYRLAHQDKENALKRKYHESLKNHSRLSSSL